MHNSVYPRDDAPRRHPAGRTSVHQLDAVRLDCIPTWRGCKITTTSRQNIIQKKLFLMIFRG